MNGPWKFKIYFHLQFIVKYCLKFYFYFLTCHAKGHLKKSSDESIWIFKKFDSFFFINIKFNKTAGESFRMTTEISLWVRIRITCTCLQVAQEILWRSWICRRWWTLWTPMHVKNRRECSKKSNKSFEMIDDSASDSLQKRSPSINHSWVVEAVKIPFLHSVL